MFPTFWQQRLAGHGFLEQVYVVLSLWRDRIMSNDNM